MNSAKKRIVNHQAHMSLKGETYKKFIKYIREHLFSEHKDTAHVSDDEWEEVASILNTHEYWSMYATQNTKTWRSRCLLSLMKNEEGTRREKILNENIKALLVQGGISRKELSEGIGMPQSSFNVRITGMHAWTKPEMSSVADFLSVTVKELRYTPNLSTVTAKEIAKENVVLPVSQHPDDPHQDTGSIVIRDDMESMKHVCTTIVKAGRSNKGLTGNQCRLLARIVEDQHGVIIDIITKQMQGTKK